MNRIESFFLLGDHNDLESTINGFCRRHKLNPVSISVVEKSGGYTAFVVVEEVNHDHP